MTTYLRFPDEATARTALASCIVGGQWITATHDYALDPVGVLYTPGRYDATGVQLNARRWRRPTD